MTSSRPWTLLASLLGTLAAGCGEYTGDAGHGDDAPWQSAEGDAGFSGGPGGFGVTPGGAKDIKYARDVIAMGGVPKGADITPEGLLSEHDLPVDGTACATLFCLRPALGVAPSLETGEREYYIQLGMVSGLDPATFHRPPLDLVVLVDHSSSMSIDQAQTNAAAARIVDHLTAGDRLAVLAFNEHIDVVQPFGAVADKATVQQHIRTIQSGGSWDFRAALTEAYRIAGAAGDDPTRLRRVIVFSCGYPVVDPAATDNPIQTLIHDGASHRIGLSFYGVLLGWNPALATVLGRERGGAYSYLRDLNDVDQTFGADFDLAMTPVLYSLNLRFEVGERFEVVRLYGIPGDPGPPVPPGTTPGTTPAPDPTPSPTAATGTGFLSNRHGAMVARLRLKPGAAADGPVGTIHLGYEPEPALGLGSGLVEAVAEVQDFSVSVPDGPQYQSPGVEKSVALVNEAVELSAACVAYQAGDHAKAAAILTTLRDYLAAERTALGAADLDVEVALVTQLLANVSQ